ncbi:hypothetical protein FA95DRAFT_1662553 [Auriscalpium vulgare]|uniref:Uncharacterized protein n=1 Tax=Auriscalpium vulgare TaxID=40419 RepID=A0ACB8RUX2_9AGAM|nr:hypothetical protein FA95DRAFT_1662553 [Auriscalpium vulgare]
MLKDFLVPPFDPRYQEIEQTLSTDPDQVIQRAKGGEVLALQVLTISCERYQALQTLEILDVFCDHLAASRIPHPLPLDLPPAALTALGCNFWSFLALKALTDKDKISLSNAARFTARIAEDWENICQWAIFWDTFSSRLSAHEQASLYHLIIEAVCIVVYHEPTRARVLKTDGFLELITSLWMKSPTGTAGTISPAVGTDRSAGLLWIILVHVPKDDRALSMDRLIKAAGGFPPRIARLALSRLHAVAKELDGGPAQAYMIHLSVLDIFTKDTARLLRVALVQQCGVSVLTRGIVALANRRDHEQRTTRDVLLLSLKVLLRLINTGDSVRWMACAVREGLIRAYGDLSPVFKRYEAEQQRTALQLLRDILPMYLVYPRIIDAVDGNLRGLTNKPAPKNKGSLLKAWTVLERRARLSARLKDKWDDVKNMAYCSNCTKYVDKSFLKTCARCRDVYYCSTACQITAWEVHKKMCSLLLRDLPSRNDRNFLNWIALQNARRESADLQTQAAELYPNTALSDIGVVFYCTDASPNLSVLHLGNYKMPSMGRAEVTLAESIVQRARATPGGATLIASRTKLGKREMLSLMLVTPSIWDESGEANQRILDSMMMEAGDSEDQRKDSEEAEVKGERDGDDG